MKKSFKNMAPDGFYIDFHSESDGLGEESNKTDSWYLPQLLQMWRIIWDQRFCHKFKDFDNITEFQRKNFEKNTGELNFIHKHLDLANKSVLKLTEILSFCVQNDFTNGWKKFGRTNVDSASEVEKNHW